MGVGFVVPHIEIAEITYLIIREKFNHLYYKVENLFFKIAKPFIWLFFTISKIVSFIFHKSRDYMETRETHKREKFQEENEEVEKEFWDDVFDEETDEEPHEEPKHTEKKKPKKEKPTSRWESKSAYVVLGLGSGASQEEIKKAYRTLSKIYHPDLSLTKKDEYEEIFKRINWAYRSLKK